MECGPGEMIIAQIQRVIIKVRFRTELVMIHVSGQVDHGLWSLSPPSSVELKRKNTTIL